MDKHTNQLIAGEVIRTLLNRFANFPSDAEGNRNAPFHEAFLEAFSDRISEKVYDKTYLITISSWLHGLNTTLGQSFFENVAQIISGGRKATFKGNQMTQTQARNINEIMTDLKNNSDAPDIEDEKEKIKIESPQTEDLIPAPDFTVDCFVESKDEILAIELKSVKPNAGEMRGEKQKILNGRAVFEHLYPEKKNIEFLIGFPFDPEGSSDTGYNKKEFIKTVVDLKKYFHEDEILLSEELWDRLSGESNTMEKILGIIRDIATPKFSEKFALINELKNYKDFPVECRGILEKWHLEEEIIILDHIEDLFKEAESNKKLDRFLRNQTLVKSDNRYNESRNLKIREFIKENL